MSRITHQSIPATLIKAAQLHQAGRLAEAERLYTAVLKTDPANSDALNLKGAIASAQGRQEDALVLFERAIAALPSFADAHFNQANSLAALGRTDEALTAYAQAVALKPAYADARLNLGGLLQKIGRRDAALAVFRDMTRICPADARGHANLGICLGEALPTAASHDQAPMAAEAMTAFARSLVLAPNSADAHLAYASFLSQRADHARAITHIQTALVLNPKWSKAWCNLGAELDAVGERSKALAAFARALEVDSTCVPAIVNRGLTLLALGCFHQGWDDYARRFDHSATPFIRRTWPWPPWQGESLSGKSILIWSDQGIGDEILYAGMIPEVAAAAGLCVLECSPKLEALFRRSFPAIDVVAHAPADYADLPARRFDFQCSILDLGRWLRRGPGRFPNRPAYLQADRVRAANLRRSYRALSTSARKLIGLSWKSINPLMGREKSLALSDFAEVLASPKFTFVNVQYGDVSEDLAKLKSAQDLPLFTDPTVDIWGDVDAAAAQIAALDLVVTVSNTAAHMAGALGVPTMLYVPRGKRHLWYWRDAGAKNPWYRSVTVHRGPLVDYLDDLQKIMAMIEA